MGVPGRAVRQILLGLTPLVVIAVVSLILLALRLGEASEPLRTATETASAEVTSSGLGADARQIAVEYTDAEGQLQTARLTLDRAVEIPLGEQLEVVYDPQRPGVVYVQGDAVTSTVGDLVNGMLIVALVLVVAVVVTIVRLIGRRRLASRAPRQLRAHREKYRRGVADRSWLVVQAGGSVRSGDSTSWVPVYWDVAVEQLGESPVLVTVYGDPDRDSLLGFELSGEPVWPSGRRREQAPKGRERELAAPSGGVSLLGQTRTDAVGVFTAPLIGILWAYIDGSGPAGFVFATAVSAGVLFWLPSVYGSDPT